MHLVIIASINTVKTDIKIEMKKGTNHPSITKLLPIIALVSFKIMTSIKGYNIPSVIIVTGSANNFNKGFTVWFKSIITKAASNAYLKEEM